MPYVDLSKNIQSQKNYWDMAREIFNAPAPDPIANLSKMFLPFVSQSAGETPWFSPETALDIMAVSPFIPAMTRLQTVRNTYKMGVRGAPKPIRRQFIKGVFETPQSHLDTLKKVGPLSERELSDPSLFGVYRPESRSIGLKPTGGLMGQAVENMPNTFFHEMMHHIYPQVSREDRITLRTVVERMWPSHRKKMLARQTGTQFLTPEEVLAQAYAEYRMGSEYFYKFPPRVRDLVKKYAME